MMDRVPDIWIVDDDDSIRQVLTRALTQARYQVSHFSTATALRQALQHQQPELILCDVRLPDANGLSLLDEIRTDFPAVVFIAMTAYTDLELTVSAFQRGVFDYLSKPFDLDEVLALVGKALQQAPLPGPKSPAGEEKLLIGSSAAMQKIFRMIGRLSGSDISVLITGETGTGKELIARSLHHHSPRQKKPFVAINAAAIPAELLESELFGHERGAFTGAVNRRMGRFEEAQHGTLFLDEIGDMPLALQTRLLRVLAEGEYYRVGGRDLLRTDVRVIAATHQDLSALTATGQFREDLFHRLNVIHLQLPALRERPEDIASLARHFLARFAKEMDLEEKRLHPACIERLKQLRWPGNVRQLENLCRQWCVVVAGEVISTHDIPVALQHSDDVSQDDHSQISSWATVLEAWVNEQLHSGAGELLPRTQQRLERTLIHTALEFTGGNQSKAAQLLGCGRNTLIRKLKQLSHKARQVEKQDC